MYSTAHTAGRVYTVQLYSLSKLVQPYVQLSCRGPDERALAVTTLDRLDRPSQRNISKMSNLHSQNSDPTSIMYIEHYLDVVENLPSNLARLMSRIHEIDIQRTKIASLIDNSLQNYLQNTFTEGEKRKLLNKFLSMMVQLQQLSDTKICLAQAIYDQIDLKTRQLESQGRGLPISNASLAHQAHTSSSTHNSNGSNNVVHSSNANSYANANGSVNSSSARVANTAGTGNSNNSHTLNVPLARSESNNSTDGKAPISAATKDNTGNGKETNTSTSGNANHSNGNGKRTSRRSQGASTTTNNNSNSNSNGNNKKDKTSDKDKEDSNGGSGDDRSSTPVANERNTGTGKRGVASKRGVKGGRKGNEGKRRKSSYNYDDSPTAVYNSIDPDEPTYCLCEQVSYGEMICCDNASCKIEWFHFTCVGLSSIPKGRWYCPECRGERSNIQKKPNAQ